MSVLSRAKPAHRRRRLRWSVTVAVVIGGLLASWSPAEAIPSFARQTGLPCAACHNNFPQLTPLGRQFKMLGYEFAPAPPSLKQFSLMTVSSFTHTDAGQPGGAAKGFGDNNNLAQDAISLFYGGPIYSRLAAFIQATYDGIADHFAIDNTDIRLAKPFSLGEVPVIVGRDTAG